MICTNCGNENKENAKFCFKCGAKLTASSAVPVVKPARVEASETSQETTALTDEVQSTPVTEDLSTRPLSLAAIYFKEDGREIQVPYKPVVLIGRLDKRSNIIPELDLTEADKDKVTSRKHSRILFSKGKYMLVDLGSMNGTYLNGKRLNSNVEYDLKSGDEIMFGTLVCTFKSIS